MSYAISLYLSTFCLFAFSGKVLTYEVPPAIIELLNPQGFRVSIPDYEGITLFAFHGNVNEDFENGKEAGQMSVDIARKRNGFWSYTNRNIRLKQGDIIYYWLYVIKDGLGYERLFQSYEVKDSLPAPGPPTPRPPTPKPPTPPTPPPPPPPPTPTTTTRRPTTHPDDAIHFPTRTSPHTTTDIDIRNQGAQGCSKKSITEVNGMATCSGELVFDSDFSNEIGRNWTNEVHFNDDESEFVVFDNLPTNSFIESGKLIIQPTLLDDHYGKEFALRGPLNLADRCTSREHKCERVRVSYGILPPVISARITTESLFSFKYGIVEIKAKLPKGDWVIPEIWLQPKRYRYGPNNSGKVVVAKSIGNTLLTLDGEQIGSTLLTSGLQVNDKTQTFKKMKDIGLWSDDFHIFKLEWTDSRMAFYVDGLELGEWDGKTVPLLEGHNILSPFDQEFYFVLGIHVGGYEDIPDGAESSGRPKPWRNTETKRLRKFYVDLNNWHSSWSDKTRLQVDYVRVYAI